MTGRWRVESDGYLATEWFAVQPDHADADKAWDAGCHIGRAVAIRCGCREFSTWREAFDYADRMARAER